MQSNMSFERNKRKEKTPYQAATMKRGKTWERKDKRKQDYEA